MRTFGSGGIRDSMSSGGTERFLGTNEVARYCQVSPATVGSWIDRGLLKGHKTPTGRRRVSSSDLVGFLQAHNIPVVPELTDGKPRDVVVVVEDDAAYLRALVRTIEVSDLDVDVVDATNGVDGLLEIGRVSPSLIVLDYRLPDINADEVVQRLLEPGRHLEAKVMVVTGGMSEPEVERIRRLGVRVVINKADGMDAVIAAIRQSLAQREVALGGPA